MEPYPPLRLKGVPLPFSGKILTAIEILRQVPGGLQFAMKCDQTRRTIVMQRNATFLLLSLYLVATVVTCPAKKKSPKPIIEIFEASVPGGETLRFEIEEFSTDQDIEELAKTYNKGGKDDVERDLRKVEKGRYVIHDTSYAIRLVRSISQNGTRSVFIVADAADRIMGDVGGMVFIGHKGYPFAFTLLRLDQQGKGVGQQMPFAAVTFNKQGVIDVKSMPLGSGANSAIRLAGAHVVPQ